MTVVPLDRGVGSNQQIKLSVRTVTVRACARPAPACPAAYLQRYADANGRHERKSRWRTSS